MSYSAASPRPAASLDFGRLAICLFLAGWPMLIAAPQFAGMDATRLPLLAVAALILGILFLGRLSRTSHVATRVHPGVLWTFVLLAAIGVAALRAPDSALPLTAKAGLALGPLLLFSIALLAFSSEDPSTRRERLVATLLALPVFVAVNMAYYVLDPGQQAQLALTRSNANATLSMVGILQPRLQYLPAISGSAIIGTIAAISLLSLAHLVTSERRLRLPALALSIPCAVALVLADTRGMIVGGAVCIGLYLVLSPSALRRLAGLAVLFAAISSVVLTLFFTFVSALPIGNLLVRSSEMGVRLGTGTGRTLIWNGVFSELADVKPIHFLGYGLFGDTRSGVSASYAWMFSGMDGVATYHNAALQYVLDSGYFVAALYFVVIWLAARSIAAQGAALREAKVLLALLILILIGGLTEAAGTVYHYEAFLALMILLGVAFARPRALR